MSNAPVRTPEEHLRNADPVLGAIMDEIVREDGDARPMLVPDPTLPSDPNMPTDSYGVLVRAIVSQNISVIASRSIYRRLTERFGGRPPNPQEILGADPDELRLAAGLSRAKMVSLHSLAEHIVSGELALERLHELPDEEVVAQLDAVRGIGAWTAHMFLIFHLRRPDVLAAGDLELRRTVRYLYRLPGLPGPTELEQIAEPWRPHRTLASLYLWRLAEKTPRIFSSA
jgi:DNA-3-methyladenine glycosylase II